MKNIFLPALLLCGCLRVLAQPVPFFTREEFPTAKQPLSYSAAGLSTGITASLVPQGGVDMTWDYTSLPVGTATSLDWGYASPSGTATGLGTLIRGEFFEVLAAGRGYYYSEVFRKSDTGFHVSGRHVAEQHYSLFGLPGAQTTDSIIFEDQAIAYTSPLNVLKFPMTENSATHSHAVYEVTGKITLAAFMLNQTPVSKRTHEVRTDSVIGWGTLTVPALSGPSASYHVLLVERKSVITDSIFLNGAPAPAPFLSGFGLTQGAITTSYRRSLWTTGRFQPLMIVYSTNAAFTQGLSATVATDVVGGDALTWNDFLFDGTTSLPIDLRSAADSSVYPASVAGGSAQTFDFSGIRAGYNASYTLAAAANTLESFEGETYLDREIFEYLTPTAGYLYDNVLRVSSHGYFSPGRHVQEQRYGLAGLAPTDSLIIPEQDVVYETPLYYLRFPLTGQSVMHSQVKHELNGLLTVGAFMLNNTPISKKTHETRTDSVIGSGQIILPALNGIPAFPIDVMLVERHTRTVDSIFLGGAPAPAQLLSAFSIVQGEVTVGSSYQFWSPGRLAASLYTRFSSATPGSIIEHAWFRGDLPPSHNAVQGAAQAMLGVFPNPATQSLFLTGTLAEGQSWHLTDLSGREVITGTSENNGFFTRQVDVSALSRGLYVLVVRNADGSVGGSAKVSLK